MYMNPITSFLVFALVAGAFALGYTGHLLVGVALLASRPSSPRR
jgi:hypothetical protein